MNSATRKALTGGTVSLPVFAATFGTLARALALSALGWWAATTASGVWLYVAALVTVFLVVWEARLTYRRLSVWTRFEVEARESVDRCERLQDELIETADAMLAHACSLDDGKILFRRVLCDLVREGLVPPLFFIRKGGGGYTSKNDAADFFGAWVDEERAKYRGEKPQWLQTLSKFVDEHRMTSRAAASW